MPELHTEEEHAAVLHEALAIWKQRQAKYQDNWRHQGMRGNLFKLRWKVERAWMSLWHLPLHNVEGTIDVDDLLDSINYAVCAIRLARERNRDGDWFW